VVISGQGQLDVDGVAVDVAYGSTVYVPAGASHRFHTVTEDLEILVLFAPPLD